MVMLFFRLLLLLLPDSPLRPLVLLAASVSDRSSAHSCPSGMAPEASEVLLLRVVVFVTAWGLVRLSLHLTEAEHLDLHLHFDLHLHLYLHLHLQACRED